MALLSLGHAHGGGLWGGAVPDGLDAIVRHWEVLSLTFGARGMALVWGLLWASFANVVILRLPEEEGVVRGRSRCGSCGVGIRWFDNIPVLSYLLLRGKCRSCGARFSARYVVVELIGGVLSLALYMKLVVAPIVLASGDASLLRWISVFFFALALVVIIFIDLDHWFIPDEIVLPMAAVGAGVAAAGYGDPNWVWWHGALAGVAFYGVFAGLRAFYLWRRGIEALGLGDAKLMLMLGAWLGPVGLTWSVGAGAIQGLLVSVPMLRMGKQVASRSLEEVAGDDPLLAVAEEDHDRVMAQRVPFGPFLAVAALEWVLLSETLSEYLERLVDQLAPWMARVATMLGG